MVSSIVMVPGIDKAWEKLSLLDPGAVQKDSGAFYNVEAGAYMVKSLGLEFAVYPAQRRIAGTSTEAEELRQRIKYFLDLSAVWYLVSAKDIAPSGRLIKPSNLKGGHHFFTGSHELPLKALASRYGSDGAGFLNRAAGFGAREMDYGDASVELYPMPRVPLDIILWLEDEEFPPRADLLFDSSADVQIPLDISWSLAMMSVIVFL